MRNDKRLKIAKMVSNLFNPFVIIGPIQCSLFLLVGELTDHLINLLLIIFLQQILPMILLFTFMKLKIISDFDITDRKERTGYFLIVLILFLISLIFTGVVGISNIVTISISITLLLITIINLWWKISGHMVFDSILLCGIIYVSSIFYVFIPIIPLVAWSRVEQKKHSWLQTIVGTILGTIVFFTIVLLH